MISWFTVSSIGSSAILIPVAFAIAVWLLAARAWGAALYWCVLFGAAMLTVIASKVIFIGWGIGIESLDFTGISGHSARATAIFPTLFYLVFQKTPRKIYSLPVLSGWVAGVIICISRVVVDAHSVSEALSGGILGTAVSFFFLHTAGKYPLLISPRWLLIPSLCFLLSAPNIKPAPTQQWMTSAALALSGRTTPFNRSMLHQYPSKKKYSGIPHPDTTD